jgi:hypothetical protein
MSDTTHPACGGCCSQHNELRSVTMHVNGSYLSGWVVPCDCLCDRCVTRQQAIDAEIEAADKYIRESYASSQETS